MYVSKLLLDYTLCKNKVLDDFIGLQFKQTVLDYPIRVDPILRAECYCNMYVYTQLNNIAIVTVAQCTMMYTTNMYTAL